MFAYININVCFHLQQEQEQYVKERGSRGNSQIKMVMIWKKEDRSHCRRQFGHVCYGKEPLQGPGGEKTTPFLSRTKNVYTVTVEALIYSSEARAHINYRQKDIKKIRVQYSD